MISDIKLMKEMAKELKLRYTASDLEVEIMEANKANLSYEELIKSILEKGYDLRKENGERNQIRNARFPYKKHLEDLDLNSLSEEVKSKMRCFSSLDFINSG